MRLLIIDDDPFVLDSMRFVLKLDGHEIIEANGGQDGIDAFHAALEGGQAFDAVITDLGMPKVDGLQVASAVKGRSAETPVVLLTGWGRRMKTRDDRTVHVDFFLDKPPQLDELREILVQISREEAKTA
jgi:DNA-binding NtrC family response regulator